MIEQPDIFGDSHTVTPAGKALTPRQQRVYDLARTTPGGITADEAGAQLHADAGKHHPDSRCQWCASTGKDVLESKAVGPLLVRRRASGRYEPRDGSGTPVLPQPSSQMRDLPGDRFEDIFGDAA